MNFRWTDELVRECRNISIAPYKSMSIFARRAITLLRKTGKVEFYSEAGWLPVSKENGAIYAPVLTRAYRIAPWWNPMAKKGGAS